MDKEKCEKCRCSWAKSSQSMIDYHDNIWGEPIYDDNSLFAHLSLESLQCGLSWSTIWNKKDIIYPIFYDFDIKKVALIDDIKAQKIKETDGMIGCINKIKAIVNNAKIVINMQKEHVSFSNFLWKYTDNKTLVYKSHNDTLIAKNILSEKIAKDLKKLGFKYVGAVTIYSFLQACGFINDHSKNCFRYEQINKSNKITFLE